MGAWGLINARWYQSLNVDMSQLPATESGLIRVQVSDGFLTATDVSDGIFSTPNSPPSILIVAPRPFAFYGGTQTIVLKAMANDIEDEVLVDGDFKWMSDIDGFLGTGAALALSITELTRMLLRNGYWAQLCAMNILTISGLPPTTEYQHTMP